MSFFDCSICHTCISLAKAIICTANENHRICSSCVTAYFKTSIAEKAGCKNCLFNKNCEGHYTNAIIRALIPNDMYKQLKKQWKTLRLNSLALQPSFQICPFCTKYGSKFDIAGDNFNCVNSLNCEYCHKQWCTRCFGELNASNVFSHRCARFNREFKIQTVNKNFIEQCVEALTTGILFRTCPRCNIKYEKRDGCAIITCMACQCVSCWICESEIRNGDHLIGSNYSKIHKIYNNSHEYEKHNNTELSSVNWIDFVFYTFKVIRIVYLLELNTNEFIRKTIIEKANQLKIFSKYINEFKE